MLTLKILFILSAITGFLPTVSSQSTSTNHVGCTYSFKGLCSSEEDKQEIAALTQQVRHLDGTLQLAEDRIRKQLLNLTKEAMLHPLNHTVNLEEQLQTMNTTLYLTKDKLRLVEKHFRNVTAELQQVKENAQQLEDKQENLPLVEERLRNVTSELQQVKEHAQQLEDKQEKLQLVEERLRNVTSELQQVKENAQQLEDKQEKLQLVEERLRNVTTELQQLKENAQQLQNLLLKGNECNCQQDLDLLNSTLTNLYHKVAAEGKDCAELYEKGVKRSGVYTISLSDNKEEFDVYCDMKTDRGGWTVFQRRQDGSVDFYRDWNDYEMGFGYIAGEFWLGNDKLHRLTAVKSYTLRVDLENWSGVEKYAIYQELAISNENDKYRITFGSYSGDAGNSLSKHRGQQFSTKDQDNDKNCANRWNGAWWYTNCYDANLNGIYFKQETIDNRGILWFHFSNSWKTLKMTEMKIRPTGF